MKARSITIPEFGIRITERVRNNTEEEHFFEYTEQDIYEQLRKKLYSYKKVCNEAVNLHFFKT